MPHSQGLANNSYPEPNQHNSSSEALCDVSEHPCFYSVRLLAPRQTPNLEDHSWSAVHDCLLNITYFYISWKLRYCTSSELSVTDEIEFGRRNGHVVMVEECGDLF